MSKHRNKEARVLLSDITGLPVEILGRPIFQMFSDHELVIEGAKSLDYYDESLAKIRTEKMTVTITGECLVIKCLANKNISVCGHITDIGLEHT